MRTTASALWGLLCAGLLVAGPAWADPEPVPTPAVSFDCNDAYCTPGIAGNAVLGAPCDDTSHYVFGTTSWGRLVFCGSPRRYEPRYFRTMPMVGIKQLNANCTGYEDAVAQDPDGLFLVCGAQDGGARWRRGDA
ncbi:hypothetical protein BH09ACT8_BH09ACT8_62470 [soil metagenome]